MLDFTFRTSSIQNCLHFANLIQNGFIPLAIASTETHTGRASGTQQETDRPDFLALFGWHWSVMKKITLKFSGFVCHWLRQCILHTAGGCLHFVETTRYVFFPRNLGANETHTGTASGTQQQIGRAGIRSSRFMRLADQIVAVAQSSVLSPSSVRGRRLRERPVVSSCCD